MRRIRQHWVVALISVAVLVFLYLPIVNVVVNSVNANPHLLSWGGFTLEWFVDVLTSDDFVQAFLQSLFIAAVVMVASVVIATTAVVGGREWGDRMQLFQGTSMYLRLTLPEVVIVVGLLAIVKLVPGSTLGPWWVILGQTIIYSAYDMVIIKARLSTIADLYENAAYDLGADTWRCLKTVILPLLAPSILVGALMAFTFSLDAVVGVVFLGGPRTETVPILIMSLIKKGITPEVNAMGVIVTLFNLIVLFVIVKVVGVRQAVSALGGGK